MNEFLKIEYEQCYSLVKHYDDRFMSLLKFSIGISSAIISVIGILMKIDTKLTIGIEISTVISTKS